MQQGCEKLWQEEVIVVGQGNTEELCILTHNAFTLKAANCTVLFGAKMKVKMCALWLEWTNQRLRNSPCWSQEGGIFSPFTGLWSHIQVYAEVSRFALKFLLALANDRHCGQTQECLTHLVIILCMSWGFSSKALGTYAMELVIKVAALGRETTPRLNVVD